MKCSKRTSKGNPCRSPAINGTNPLVCRMHGGSAPQVRKKAAVRAELMAWGLTEEYVDPGDTLLRLVSQSARRAGRYAQLLAEAYEAAERLRVAEQEDHLDIREGDDDDARAEQAREDLRRIFNAGGVGALIGHTFAAAKDVGVFKTGEAIRGLAELEAQERDRCARFCKLALDAGIEAKKIELAQRHVDLLDAALRMALVKLGHDLNDPLVVAAVMESFDVLTPALT